MATQVLSVAQVDEALCEPIMLGSYRLGKNFVRLSFDPRDCELILVHGTTIRNQKGVRYTHTQKEDAVIHYNNLVKGLQSWQPKHKS